MLAGYSPALVKDRLITEAVNSHISCDIFGLLGYFHWSYKQC